MTADLVSGPAVICPFILSHHHLILQLKINRCSSVRGEPPRSRPPASKDNIQLANSTASRPCPINQQQRRRPAAAGDDPPSSCNLMRLLISHTRCLSIHCTNIKSILHLDVQIRWVQAVRAAITRRVCGAWGRASIAQSQRERGRFVGSHRVWEWSVGDSRGGGCWCLWATEGDKIHTHTHTHCQPTPLSPLTSHHPTILLTPLPFFWTFNCFCSYEGRQRECEGSRPQRCYPPYCWTSPQINIDINQHQRHAAGGSPLPLVLNTGHGACLTLEVHQSEGSSTDLDPSHMLTLLCRAGGWKLSHRLPPPLIYFYICFSSQDFFFQISPEQLNLFLY